MSKKTKKPEPGPYDQMCPFMRDQITTEVELKHYIHNLRNSGVMMNIYLKPGADEALINEARVWIGEYNAMLACGTMRDHAQRSGVDFPLMDDKCSDVKALSDSIKAGLENLTKLVSSF